MTTRDERRTTLLDAARDIILRFGYRKATLEDIAAEAGVSRATVYNYFTSKEEVFQAIIQREVEILREVMLASADPESAPEERLMDFVRTHFRHLRAIRTLYSVNQIAAKDVMPMVQDFITGFDKDVRAFLAATLQEGVDSGRFRSVDTHALAGALQAALRGLDEAFVFEGAEAARDGALLLWEALLAGLIARPAEEDG
ncbi:MAG: TetR/AcrR family transcriptional regulator [Deltaproteobacteria bacterium]|nr:TetR/AcrR family transcriptional regulator [Deltaproteobacteria bacterium]